MGMTVTEKILARAGGKERVIPGEIVNAAVDRAMIQDNNGPIVIREFKRIDVDKVWDASKVVFIIDHHSPSSTIKAAEHQANIRRFVREQGIENFFDCGRGICHILMLENKLTGTGRVVVGTDSHTTGEGASGSFATGIGATEMASVLATGYIWLRVPESMRVDFTGNLQQGVDARDVIALVMKEVGPSGANYMAMEFTGNLVQEFDLNARATLCMMGVEMGAKNAIIVPSPGETDEGVVESDPDAVYREVLRFDVSGLEPLVACPPIPTNVHPVRDAGKVPLNQAVLGSCAGGTLRDLKLAAGILRGRKVLPSVRFIVIPASKETYREAMRQGILETLHDSGAIISSPACAACAGFEIGVLAPGEVCISTTTRNMPGRMGPGGEIYLASAYTVAASAVTGYITDPREFI